MAAACDGFAITTTSDPAEPVDVPSIDELEVVTDGIRITTSVATAPAPKAAESPADPLGFPAKTST